MPVHREREFGLRAGQRGLVLAAPALTSTVSALRLGWLRARFGAANRIGFASVLCTIAFLRVVVAGTLPLLLAGTMLYGAGEGMCIPTLQDVVTGAAPTAQRGAVVALWVGAARAGQTIGPLAIGGIFAAVGTGRTFALGGALAAALVVAQAIGRFGTEPATAASPCEHPNPANRAPPNPAT